MAQDNPYLARSISLTNYAARLAAVAERELCLQWGGGRKSTSRVCENLWGPDAGGE